MPEHATPQATIAVRSPAGTLHDWPGELLGFCAAHPVADFPPDVVERILTGLVRGPEAVLEVHGERGRLAVAAVVDTCMNRDRSADLALLGQVAPGLDETAVRALVAAAEDRARSGPLEILDVNLGASKGGWAPWLEALGYREAYAVFTMARPADLPLCEARTPLPETLAWRRLDLARIRDYHRVIAEAYAAVPGAFIAPIEDLERSLRNAPEPPLVLMQGDRVRAYLQIRMHHTESGPMGELRSLGRDPALRGLGLGDHIVRRGIRELVARGARRLELNVAAENSAALALYQRHGFTVVRRIVTVRRRL